MKLRYNKCKQKVINITNKIILRLFVLLIIVYSGDASAQYREAPVKALFIEAASRFITWPDTAYENQEKFAVGIYNDEKMSQYIKDAFTKQQPKNRVVKIISFDSINEIDNCQLLFISETAGKHVKQIVEKVKNKNVFTISDDPALSGTGVMMIVYIESQKIQCIIDEGAVYGTDLKISYHLMKKAKIINSSGVKN